MKRIAICLILVVLGCKRTPDVPDALLAANRALAGVDLGVDASKEVIDRATELRMEQCAAEPPGDARGACMGALGRHVAPAYEKAGAAYDAAVAALQALAEAWEELQPVLDEAREVSP